MFSQVPRNRAWLQNETHCLYTTKSQEHIATQKLQKETKYSNSIHQYTPRISTTHNCQVISIAIICTRQYFVPWLCLLMSVADLSNGLLKPKQNTHAYACLPTCKQVAIATVKNTNEGFEFHNPSWWLCIAAPARADILKGSTEGHWEKLLGLENPFCSTICWENKNVHVDTCRIS